MKSAGIHGQILDVTCLDDGAKLVQQIVQDHGRLHCLINNAGISSTTPASAYITGKCLVVDGGLTSM